jgi:hypothetical protein
MIQALVVYGRAITNASRQSDRRSCELLKRLMPDKRGAQKKTGRLQMSRPAEFAPGCGNKRTASYGQTCTVRTRYPLNSSTHTRRLAQ